MQKLHVLIAERWRWLQQHNIVESRYDLRATTVRGWRRLPRTFFYKFQVFHFQLRDVLRVA